ncbi:MAG: hypothetical protein EA364_15840 [Balneolaceae bacterium]|nr:MAG: hypothetical protein EA364_15840 [Balneolaceae bacterium]
MKVRYIKAVILPVICLFATEAFSQQVTFRHLTIDYGLSQNAVYTILHDSRGFMWFGTKEHEGTTFTIELNV